MTRLSNRECIDACNELLREELAAVATYNQAIEKFESPVERTVLQEILEDHTHNAAVLREQVIAMGGTPSESSGIWGDFALAVAGAARLLGKSPALEVLRAGENYGIREYEDAMEADGVMPEIKQRIAQDLLPVLGEHLDMLDRLAA